MCRRTTWSGRTSSSCCSIRRHLGTTRLQCERLKLHHQGLRSAVRRATHRWPYACRDRVPSTPRRSRTRLACTSVGVDPNTKTDRSTTRRPEVRCITQINDVPYTNPFGQRRHAAAVRAAVDVQPAGPLRLDSRGAYRPFAWVAASHVAAMSNRAGEFPRRQRSERESPTVGLPSTTLLRYPDTAPTPRTTPASGVGKDTWTAQIAMPQRHQRLRPDQRIRQPVYQGGCSAASPGH